MKDKPVILGKSYELTITGFSHQGEGIGRVNNFAVFIPGVIPDEKVRATITEVRKNYAKGQLEKIITSSASRVDTPCTFADHCGGCQLQHISYQKQLELKQKMVSDNLMKIGGINAEVQPTLGMEYPWRYRNKGHFHLDNVNGEVRFGFYEPGSHEFVPAKKSLIFSTVVNKLIDYLEEQLTIQEVEIYDRRIGKGYLRNIMIRESWATCQLMIIFITNEKGWKLDEVVKSLVEVFPQVVSVYQNINKSNKPMVLGEKFKLIRGQAFLEDTIGPYVFKISPQSFFQVNNQQTQVLYEKALEYARLTEEETVIDAYCGIGSIAIYFAAQAKKVIGIEVINEAIKDAQENAKLNKVDNVEFVAGKVEEWLPQWVKAGGRADVIVVDPPRKGCAPETLAAIVEARPEKVVYVSCNPSTLARDLKYLVKKGYGVREVQPVDMFPQTAHTEVVCKIVRNDKGFRD